MDGRAGATLSLNVLSFQTSFETWTTAAIINWKKLLRLSVVSKLEEISSLRPAMPLASALFPTGHFLPTKVYFFFFFKKKCWLEGRFVGELRENGHGRVAKG